MLQNIISLHLLREKGARSLNLIYAAVCCFLQQYRTVSRTCTRRCLPHQKKDKARMNTALNFVGFRTGGSESLPWGHGTPARQQVCNRKIEGKNASIGAHAQLLIQVANTQKCRGAVSDSLTKQAMENAATPPSPKDGLCRLFPRFCFSSVSRALLLFSLPPLGDAWCTIREESPSGCAHTYITLKPKKHKIPHKIYADVDRPINQPIKNLTPTLDVFRPCTTHTAVTPVFLETNKQNDQPSKRNKQELAAASKWNGIRAII